VIGSIVGGSFVALMHRLIYLLYELIAVALSFLVFRGLLITYLGIDPYAWRLKDW
jgi:hypothetical protein